MIIWASTSYKASFHNTHHLVRAFIWWKLSLLIRYWTITWFSFLVVDLSRQHLSKNKYLSKNKFIFPLTTTLSQLLIFNDSSLRLTLIHSQYNVRVPLTDTNPIPTLGIIHPSDFDQSTLLPLHLCSWSVFSGRDSLVHSLEVQWQLQLARSLVPISR